MPVPQLGDDGDGVESSVLGEGGGDDLESLSEGLETVGFHSLEGLTVLSEQTRDVDLRGSSSDDEGSAKGKNKRGREGRGGQRRKERERDSTEGRTMKIEGRL